jgi:hypothetical protein
VLQVGGLSALGLGLSDLLRVQAADAATPDPAQPTARSFGAADSVILLWLSGGPSHLDMWDMKPEASGEIRGEFKPIKTNLPGLEISELLPRIAKRADQFTMLRGITHNRGEHEGAHIWLLTGYKPTRPFFALHDPSQDQPSLGSVVVNELGAKSAVPPYVCVPVVSYNGSFQSFLSRRCAPFEVNGDPNKPDFQVRDLGRIAALTDSRFDRRRRMLSRVDNPFKQYDQVVDTLASKDEYYARAYDLIGSARMRGAFDLSQEPKDLRNAYGRNVLGQSTLLARRLIEYGSRFVTIDNIYWWMYCVNYCD